MAHLYPLIDKATAAIGRLDGMSMILPDAGLFLYMYVRKEAVLSYQIEGTQSSLSDLLMSEVDQIPGTPMDDVNEVSSYVAALDYGMKRLHELPLLLRLLRETHACLLNNTRGSHKKPGEFRTTQNWIEFFLEGMIETSEQAIETAESIVKLFKEDRSAIENSNRSTSSTLAIHALMQHRSILTTSQIATETGSSLPTVLRNLAFLEDIDIVKEVTGKQRNKIFTNQAYLEMLNQGTEPLPI